MLNKKNLLILNQPAMRYNKEPNNEQNGNSLSVTEEITVTKSGKYYSEEIHETVRLEIDSDYPVFDSESDLGA